MKNIIPFNYVTDHGIIKEIVYSKLDKFAKFQQEEKMIIIEFINDARDKITDDVIKRYDTNMGGRGVITELETCFIDKLAEFLFINNKTIVDNRKQGHYTTIKVMYQDKLSFSI